MLDLGCGPGRYTAALAAHGHDCVGIDFAPAAIAYAQNVALEARLRCSYQLADIRAADYGAGYRLVMLLYGEFNIFRPADARCILTKALRALSDGGVLLLGAHTAAAVRAMADQPRTWRAAESGLFSTQPHLRLEESFWDAEQHVATTRYFIVDSTNGSVSRHAASVQAYIDRAYHAAPAECGCTVRRLQGSLSGSDEADEFVALLAVAVYRN